MRFIASMLLAALAALLSIAAATAAPRGHYVEVSGYLQADDQYEAWFNLRHGLRRGFDDICGDTFCEGDYSNLQPLRFLCSVHAASGRIGACSWTFAGSQEEVEPVTGRIGVVRGFWQCRTPLSPGTTIEQLLVALDVDEPLYAPLPGTQATIMDGLVDCL